MADPREAILARLTAVCASLTGVTTYRNRVAMPDDDVFPAIDILDGGEEAPGPVDDRHESHAPKLVTMTAMTHLFVDGNDANAGTAMNQLRARVIQAVSTDTQIKSLTHKGRGAHYAGASLVINQGRYEMGQLVLAFAATYVLRPAEVANA